MYTTSISSLLYGWKIDYRYLVLNNNSLNYLISYSNSRLIYIQWNLCNLTPGFSQQPETFDKHLWSKVFLLITKINLSIPTSCTIRHISLVPCCVGLDRFHCIYNYKQLLADLKHCCILVIFCLDMKIYICIHVHLMIY